MVRRGLGLLLWLPLMFWLALCAFVWEGRLATVERELGAEQPSARIKAVEQLLDFSPERAWPALKRAMGDKDSTVRLVAADVAARTQSAAAVPILVTWLEDNDAKLKVGAAQALGRIGEASAEAVLIRALGDPDGHVRAAAIDALVELNPGDGATVPFVARLEDSQTEVRVAAARALGWLGDARAVVPLIARARDEATPMRVAVYQTLGQLGDPRAIAALLDAVEEGPIEGRIAAARALGKLEVREAVEPLAALGKTAKARLARAALLAVGRIPGTEAVDTLVDAVRQPNTSDAATTALEQRAHRLAPAGAATREGDKQQDGERERQALVTAAATALDNAQSWGEANALAKSLAALGTRIDTAAAFDALYKATSEQRADPRVLLAALAHTAAPAALVPLLEGLEAERPSARKAAVRALATYFDRRAADGRAADPLVAALGQAGARERLQIVELLGRTHASRALQVLHPLLEQKDTELRRAATRAVGVIGHPSSARWLLPLLDDSDPAVRDEAARAVGRCAGLPTVERLLARLSKSQPADRGAYLTALGETLARLQSPPHAPKATEAQGPTRTPTQAQTSTEARNSEGIPRDLSDKTSALLLGLAGGPDPRLASAALSAFARWQPPGVAASLISFAAQASPIGSATRRAQAARLLAELDDPKAPEALRTWLADGPRALRVLAANALGEVGGPQDAEALLELVAKEAWPLPATGAFALARLARRGQLKAETQEQSAKLHSSLCNALQRHRDPYVRANVVVTLTTLKQAQCSGVDLFRWLQVRQPAALRIAAAYRLQQLARTETPVGRRARRALVRCEQHDTNPEVASACGEAVPPLEPGTLEVFAYDRKGLTLLEEALVTLRFADGTALVTYTDARGQVRMPNAPRGVFALENPYRARLEP